MSNIPQSEASRRIDRSSLPLLASRVVELLASSGVHGYLVGGVVRDAVLGQKSKGIDIDVAIDSDPHGVGKDMAVQLGGTSIVMDASRDIVRVVLFTEEGNSIIDITPLHGDIKEDLGRRDFTIDAMAVSIDEFDSGEVVDPLGGITDIGSKLVRLVSPSVFSDDPARLMRAPRLAIQLGFSIDDQTRQLVRKNAHLIGTIAQERVRDEFLKVLAEPGAKGSVRMLDDLGLLGRFLPELEDTRDVEQPKEHYWDVFNHCVETVGQIERLVPEPDNSDPIFARVPRFDEMISYFSRDISHGHTRATLLKLGGLLHDIAKPATKTIDVSGRIRFLGHQKVGEKTVSRVLNRLMFSGRTVKYVSAMVRHHLRPGQMAEKGKLPSAGATYRYYRDTEDVAVDILYLNMADYLAARGPRVSEFEREWIDRCRAIERVLKAYSEKNTPGQMPDLVGGREVMGTFGLKPGPIVGQVLESVRKAQAKGEIASTEEALKFVESELRSRGHVA